MSSDRRELELAATYQELLETLKLDSAQKQQSVGRTIIPTDRHRSFADPTQVISALPRLLTVANEAGEQTQITLLTQLGQGGMGEVFAAQQNALGRTVAVKSLRADTPVGSGQLRNILQEAWLTGYLEHPNIVPVYTLGINEQGSPLIVMKRIEGEPWSDFIHTPDKTTKTRANINLEWHIDILIQVCRAMEYAHSKGIIHRDLKPENIMIGSFGEVYVLDWGIAISLHEDLEGRLPLAEHAALLAGTPPYMAPEMTTGKGPIDERTDVYLLGAILHELLTGAPPHDGNAVPAVMLQAYISAPKTYPSHIPKPLTQIANKAMARAPEDRYPDVQTLRLALHDYLEHRASLQLSRQAQHSLDALSALTATPTHSPEQQRDIAEHFGQCRFGFMQALKQWPKNEDAQAGFIEAMMVMIRYEVEQGHLSAAQALIAELDDPPDHLKETLKALELRAKQQSERQQQLELMARDMDATIGQRSRALMSIILAVIWTALPMITGALEDLGYTTLTHKGYILGAVRVFVIAVIISFFFKRALLSTALNRKITIGLIGMTGMLILLRTVIYLNNVPLEHMLSLEVVFYALFVFVLGLLVSLKISAVSLIFVIGALLMSTFPKVDDYIGGLSNLCVLLSIGYIWKKQPLSQEPKTHDG